MFSSNTTQVSADAAYIEDVFSTWLYTGNGSTQTINNGIDLAGKGGLVWLKRRDAAFWHILTDTARGAGLNLSSNSNIAQYNDGQPTFNSNGFNLTNNNGDYNANGGTYASWTFREQPRFFDIVTWTGNGVDGRAIPHGLASVPGCIMVKQLTGTSSWRVYHRSTGASSVLILNASDAATGGNSWFFTTPTATEFYVSDSLAVNAAGNTYVAYLFAHDAGGFGATGADNVISCGSFTYSSGTTVDLGYEPQWMITKAASVGSDWFIPDIMRGWTADGNAAWLEANTADAENPTAFFGVATTSTGFRVPANTGNGATYIYIAIRRGPMRTPTSGTSVFAPTAYNGTEPNSQTFSTGFTVDALLTKYRTMSIGASFRNRLAGGSFLIDTTSAAAEVNFSGESTAQVTIRTFEQNDGFRVGTGSFNAGGTGALINYSFRRAPGFFDVVCYTGNGSTQNVNHNLGVVPEMMIVKRRNASGAWVVYTATTGNSAILQLSLADAVETGAPQWNSTTPTASVLSLGTSSSANASGGTYVAYLFASCPGVSKVGSYTGTGNTQVINCGFTAGARFVLIKRTNGTGDWYVWDSARGIVAGNDPYLLLNWAATEVTNTDWVDTAASGFELSNAGSNDVNINSATYIFLAIA